MEDNLRWKTTFGGRRSSMEDNLLWKTPFHGRHLQWKMTFSGRRPSVEDDLRWKTIFSGRWPSVNRILNWILNQILNLILNRILNRILNQILNWISNQILKKYFNPPKFTYNGLMFRSVQFLFLTKYGSSRSKLSFLAFQHRLWGNGFTPNINVIHTFRQ